MTGPIYYDDGAIQATFLDAINQGLIQNTFSPLSADPSIDQFGSILANGMSAALGGPMSTSDAKRLWGGFLSSYMKIGYKFTSLGDMAQRWNVFTSMFNTSSNPNKGTDNLYAAFYTYFEEAVGTEAGGDWSIITTETEGNPYTPFNIFAPGVDYFIRNADWDSIKAEFSTVDLDPILDILTDPPIQSSIGTSAYLRITDTGSTIFGITAGETGKAVNFVNDWQKFLTVVSTVSEGDGDFPSSGLNTDAGVINAYQNIFLAFGGNQEDFVTTIKQFITNEQNTYGYFLPSQSFGRWIQQIRADNSALLDPGGFSTAISAAEELQQVLAQITSYKNTLSQATNTVNSAIQTYNQGNTETANQINALRDAYNTFIDTINGPFVGGSIDGNDLFVPNNQSSVDNYNYAATVYNSAVDVFNTYVNTKIGQVNTLNTAINAYNSNPTRNTLANLLNSYNLKTDVSSFTLSTLATVNPATFSTATSQFAGLFVVGSGDPTLLLSPPPLPSWLNNSFTVSTTSSYNPVISNELVSELSSKITYNNSLNPIAGSSLEGNNSEKVLVLNRILKLLVALIQVLQQIGVAQANHLNFTTKFQQAYTALQQQIPTFVPGGAYTVGAANQDGLNARNELNSTVNGALTDNLRNLRSLQEDSAKKQQSNINQTNDAVNQQTDICTSFIQQMNSLLGSIFR